MLNYCTFVRLHVCAIMGTVELYVFFWAVLQVVFSQYVACLIFQQFISLGHVELVKAVLHTSVSRAVRLFYLFVGQELH